MGVAPDVLGVVRGLLRGAVAWLVGLALTVGLSVLGVVEGSGLRAAGRAYVSAHAVPPGELSVVLLVPVAAVGLAGFRAGRSLRSGLTGRIRSFVQSIRGGRRERLKAAATTGALLAVGYAVVGVVVALAVGGSTPDAAVGGLIVASVVGVPAAVAGARL